MSIFGICFILYFLKLSACRGFFPLYLPNSTLNTLVQLTSSNLMIAEDLVGILSLYIQVNEILSYASG